jgi:hypothetical protein
MPSRFTVTSHGFGRLPAAARLVFKTQLQVLSPFVGIVGIK